MSAFKKYAKEAKQRLKNNFWHKVKEEREMYKSIAQDDGGSADGLMVKQKQDLKDKIYNVNYESDEQFFERVKQMLETGDIIVNPIAVLADKSALATMTESQKQSYLLKLSARYQSAVEKYKKEVKQAAR